MISSVADRMLRHRSVERLAYRSGAYRGRGIALLWHRIRPGGPSPDEVVRSVSTSTFASQLAALEELGEIVPLRELEDHRRSARPRFALSFDDDDPGHAEHTLPLLVSRGLPATFFLSGRWRHAQGPYWWEVLEDRIRERGAAAVALDHGLSHHADAPAIAAALTGTSRAEDLARTTPRQRHATMTAEHAAALVAAGMEIGFHTLHHPSLPTLDDGQVRSAVTDGRDALAAELATPIVRFAYPHGHADAQVAATVGVSGYRSAWTTTKRVTCRGDDPMLRGRWDLGHRDAEAFRAALVRGLARPRP